MDYNRGVKVVAGIPFNLRPYGEDYETSLRVARVLDMVDAQTVRLKSGERIINCPLSKIIEEGDTLTIDLSENQPHGFSSNKQSGKVLYPYPLIVELEHESGKITHIPPLNSIIGHAKKVDI